MQLPCASVFSVVFPLNSFTLACQCSVWSFVKIPAMKLWFFLILPIFFISEGHEHQTVSFFDAQRVFCLSWLSLDVICMDRDWIINAPKPTLSPYCNLCKSHHFSDEFSKCGISPAPNSSVAQLVIGPTKIAMLIWQPDFDLQYYTRAHVLWLSSLQCPFIYHCPGATMWVFIFFLSGFVSFQVPGAVQHACASVVLCSVWPLIIPLFQR